MTNTTYKKTAIGLIPSDWEVKKHKGNMISKFTDIGKVYNGWETKELEYFLDYIQPTNFISEYIEKEKSIVNCIPVLTAGKSFILGYTANNDKTFNKLPIILFDDFTTDNKYVDFSFQIRSSAAKILVAKKNTDFDFRFVFYAMQKINFISSDHKRYWISEYQFLTTPFPPLPEQQKIASILSTWDTAIDNCKEIIDNLKNRNIGLAQQLLSGKMRVKGFANSKWKTLKLGEVFKLSSGNTKPKEFGNQDKLFLYPVYGGNGIIHYAKEYLEEGEKIIIGRVGEYCGNTQKVTGKYWITDNALYSVKFLMKVNIDFLTFKLIQEDLSKLRSVGGQPQVSQQPIYAYKITVPEVKEQKAIATILDKATEELNQYQQKLETLQLQKKGLMQQLLTGKVRVRI